jgi:hypothetical protein
MTGISRKRGADVSADCCALLTPLIRGIEVGRIAFADRGESVERWERRSRVR